MDEAMDSRIKYIEMPDQFKNRANDISLTCKQHYRVCVQLAKRLALEKPRTRQEFEKVEYYKDFVIKTSQLNEQVLGLLDYTQELLNAIAADSMLLVDAKDRDIIRFQSDTIEVLSQQNEKLAKELYEQSRAHKGFTE